MFSSLSKYADAAQGVSIEGLSVEKGSFAFSGKFLPNVPSRLASACGIEAAPKVEATPAWNCTPDNGTRLLLRRRLLCILDTVGPT